MSNKKCNKCGKIIYNNSPKCDNCNNDILKSTLPLKLRWKSILIRGRMGNGFGLGEVAEHKTSLELQMFKLR